MSEVQPGVSEKDIQRYQRNAEETKKAREELFGQKNITKVKDTETKPLTLKETYATANKKQ